MRIKSVCRGSKLTARPFAMFAASSESTSTSLTYENVALKRLVFYSYHQRNFSLVQKVAKINSIAKCKIDDDDDDDAD